jgi:hypothetical protein
MSGTSRISREAYVRFCEGLGVQIPGSTRQLHRPTHLFICGRSRKGKFLLKRKSRRDRMRARLSEIKEELWRRMHQSEFCIVISTGCGIRCRCRGERESAVLSYTFVSDWSE